MTRCVEAYDSYREAKKKVKEAQAQYCKVKRGKRVDYQIDAYDELVCTMVQPELTRDEIICLWPERAARPLMEEKDGEVREDALEIITNSRIKKDIKTTVEDTKKILRSLKAKPKLPISDKFDHVKIIKGDMLEALPSLGKFELICTDPPYGVTNYEWDILNTKAWLEAIRPHLADKYTLFWFCAPKHAADIELLFREADLPIQSRIVWHRRNMSMGSKACNKFVDSWEMIFHAGNRELNFPSSWSDAWFDVQIFAAPQTNFSDEKYHPTQKPKELIERLVEFGSYPKDNILDPFAGSGTTGFVCRNDRTCTLIESEEKYVDIIEQRLGIERWKE